MFPQRSLTPEQLQQARAYRRLQVWYGLLLVVAAIFIVRLFYLQVVRHDYYAAAAKSGQLKAYTIPSERGAILARDGDAFVPLVLNEKRYSLFADPQFVSQPDSAALKLAAITGGQARQYATQMRAANTRYVVLAKKLGKEQAQAIDKLALKGIGTREEPQRTYPQGGLAAQLIGFVNDEGQGKYGIEEALEAELRGRDGLLRAITDAGGVPLVSNRDNVQIDPIAGSSVALTIDITMQRQLEELLKQGLQAAKSNSGSAVILDPNSGAVKATANYPSFNPAEFYRVEDASLFSNAAFSSPLEPGSVMKPLTAAAALEQGVVNPDTTYYDPGFYKVDGYTITNIEEVGGAATRSVRDILKLSLNTGATWLLRQMGGGELDAKARQTWHGYMSERYRFGRLTGIENYEVPGVVPDPMNGDGLNISYANTSFGQGLTVTPLQLAAALGSVINGGTYYRPHLVEKIISADGKQLPGEPQIVRRHVVSEQVSAQVREMMQQVVERNNKPALRDGYQVGGKTGTAQIAKPGGGYYDDRYNGMYIGFVGGQRPEYVIVIRVNEPKIGGYAGARAAAPLFAAVSNMLINSFAITPR